MEQRQQRRAMVRPNLKPAPDPNLTRVSVTLGPWRIGLHMPGAELSIYPWQDSPGLLADIELDLELRPERPDLASEFPHTTARQRRYSGTYATGVFDLEAGTGRFVLHPPADAPILRKGHAHDGAKEASLVVALQLVTQRGGLALHAGAVRIGDLAYLVCGQSEAGKTTLVDRLLDGWLGDEHAFVLPVDGQWMYWRWPQWHRLWPDQPRELPLGGLFGLTKDRTRTAAWPATRAEGTALLSSSAYWLPWQPQSLLLATSLTLATDFPPKWLAHNLASPTEELRRVIADSRKGSP